MELSRFGFVPLITLNDFQINLAGVSLMVNLSSTQISFAYDSLAAFIDFLKLVQISISDDLVRLEDKLD